MIKHLRKKFIILSMCSIFSVLLLIISVINIINYVNVINTTDHIVNILKEGKGEFDQNKDGIGDRPGDRPQRPMSPETPFETRFFTVVLDENGEVKSVNTERIAAIDEKEAMNCSLTLYKKNRKVGFYGSYRYGISTTENNELMYIFVDCTKELSSFQTFLYSSIAVGLSAFALIFVLIFFLSGKVMKPVAEAYEKQKRFITDASHEIKTPLTIINADVDVLEMQGTTNEWTEGIKDQVKRLTSLTEKLVFLARMDEEGNVLKMTSFSLSDAVEETIKPFHAIAISKDLEFNFEIQKNISYHGDEAFIRQLVSLLLDNALKYSDEPGKIQLKLTSAGNKVILTISNPAKDLNNDLNVLFERFYRNDASRNSETGGHGIGLSLAKAIVEAHKGKIIAQNEKNIITFTVIL